MDARGKGPHKLRPLQDIPEQRNLSATCGSQSVSDPTTPNTSPKIAGPDDAVDNTGACHVVLRLHFPLG